MNIKFFVKSPTVSLNNYTIKDLPGSSGRLDVIARCVLATLLSKDGFEENVEIWVFLDKYGVFIFNPKSFVYERFPKNELKLSDYFAEFLLNLNVKETLNLNPLSSIQISDMNFLGALLKFWEMNYSIFALKEEGTDFFQIIKNIQEKEKLLFIIGSQVDDFFSSEELLALNIPSISIGTQSYLASSVIRLLKLHILAR
jgi:tRNA (pseudouridine54-N1)-methyltransferase